MDINQRFWSKVKISDTNSHNKIPCWEWTACKNSDGYGKFQINRKLEYSHRLSYENKYGKIPQGLVINHLCRNRSCCNPEHLEQVTVKENNQKGLAGFVNGLKQRAKKQCPQGHPYSKENTYVNPKGDRICKICKLITCNQFARRKRLEVKLTVIRRKEAKEVKIK